MPEKREPLPFTTPTIARLYLQQGKLDEAEAIYSALRRERPDDPRIVEGLAEVARRRQTPAAAAGAGEDAVELRAAQGDSLECSYRVSEAGRRRASLVLGGEGALTLRLCAFPGGKQEDVALHEDRGTVAVPAAIRAPVIAAAVGLRDGSGRFAAIAHGALSVGAT